MVLLNTEYAGLTLRNPLIVGSSGLTDSAGKNRELEEAGAGAVVLKSLFEEQIERQGDILLQPSDSPEAADYIRNYVKANQVEEYLSLIRATKAVCTIPVIASINCYRADAWTEFAKQIEDAGADALELNVFYLCTDTNTSANEMYDLYISILEKVRERVAIPIIMKTGKGFSNIPGLVSRLKLHGARGVVLFNRYYQPDIDVKRMRITSGRIFSAPSELGDTLRWTALVSGIVPGISISSSCGVHDWTDAVKCLLAGATTVQLCSTIYKNGRGVIAKILEGMEKWMDETRYVAVSEFRGKLSFSRAENPSMYERSQFMKYFSGKNSDNVIFR
ncbi:MAG: dihydroorotate dehydrogenase-like protein [Tannerella sp.]|jgi:dihydroorotate dehydrogenase (fumarate)|nr:dihydroorotate dehydrogenase-like protein [Tannerella sp.]